MKIKYIPLYTIILTMVSGFSLADEDFLNPNLSAESFTLSASTGMLSGKAGELVYDADAGRKISQLDWRIKNLAIIKGNISWDAYSFLTINVNGWSSLASGAGRMDDYDWFSAEQRNWTHHSQHTNTKLNYANEYDLNIKGWLVKRDDASLGLIAGYHENRFSWTAIGGSYNYFNGAMTGDFPRNETNMGYSQRFSMPYIGITGRYRINDFEVGALLKFSDWVKAQDSDEHYLRNITFREKMSGLRYYGASVDAGYYVTTDAKVFTELSYSKYKEGKGGSQSIDNLTGVTDRDDGDAAGIANHNYSVTAGLEYRF